MAVEFLNPKGMHTNPAFSQAVTVSGPVRTVYVGGQNAVDEAGNVVGKDDLAAQVEQVLHNLKLVLDAAGASPQNIVKWTLYTVQGQDVREGFTDFQQVWGAPNPAPLITSVFVSALANPDFLLELEAVAVVPEAA